MNIELIQSSCSSIASVYVLNNYLYNQNYLNSLKEVVSKAVENNTQERLSNVHAKSTDWHDLLKIEEMKNFHTRILETLICIFKLRAPAPEASMNWSFNGSWGMKHKKGDCTIEHIHAPAPWSGAFYFDVPCETYMNLPDFHSKISVFLTTQEIKKEFLWLLIFLCDYKCRKKSD
jgi:hypothetical protein